MWDEIGPGASGGIITGYTVMYSRLPKQARSNPGITSGVVAGMVPAGTQHVLRLAEIAIEYNVSVCGNTAVGQGPCSVGVVVATAVAGVI